MSLEINYVDAPEGAQEKMMVSAENGNVMSDPESIRNGVRDIPWATLEPGVWRLDGTRKILSDTPNAGWWSERPSTAGGARRMPSLLGVTPLGAFILGDSSDGGSFSEPPKIIIEFPIPYGATGFTFTFSPSTNQWCSQINVKWYSGQNLLIDKDYYPDAPKWELAELVESFDRIEITLLSTNEPNHFAKIQKIEIGRTVLFGPREIVSARLVNEVDPTLCELTVDTMTFEMHDPENRSFLPQENQRVELVKDGELTAVHYITSSTRKSEANYTIECQSAIGLLTAEFLGGMYDKKPVEDLLEEILDGSFEYVISSVFQEMTITGYLPVCSQREALQRVAFAIGAMVTTQGSAQIRLIPVPTTVSSKFTENEIFLGGSVTSAPRFAKAEVYAHTYFKTDVTEVLMDEEDVDGENVLVTFSSPHYDYEITGGEITGFDVNWVTITASGPIKLSAKTYAHNTRGYVKRNPEATAKERGNSISVTEATLIHTGNAQEAVERLYNAVQRRQTVDQNVVVSDQKAGQITSSLTPWGTIARGHITAMESTLTQNGHVARIQIQGIEVALDSVWLYSGELYSGGMEVLY